MMASLVRPMAETKSGAGGGRGAVAIPSMMWLSGKCSSCDLCRPTSSPPTARTPQSMRHSPSVPRVTSIRKALASSMRALTSGSTLALTLGHSVWRVAPISSRLFTFFPPGHPAKTSQDFGNSRLDQALGASLCARAGPHSAYRTVFVDPLRCARTISNPIRPSNPRRHGNAALCIDDGGGHGIWKFEPLAREPALHDRVEMDL